MPRLAVCGWEDQTPRLLAALQAQGGLTPSAIADPRASRLVRARTALGLPCFQHLHELIRATEYDAVLLDGPADLADLAGHAGARGASLLLSGDAADGTTLAAVAAVATTNGVPLVVLRPELRRAAFESIRETITNEPAWAPLSLDIRLRQPRTPMAALRDAVAFVCEVFQSGITEAIASPAGADLQHPTTLSAHLRFDSGKLATISASAASTEHLSIMWEAGAGSAVISATGETALLRLEPIGEEPQMLRITDGDTVSREAARSAHVLDGAGSDAFTAPRSAAALLAIERALRTGQVQRVIDAPARPALRVLTGGATDHAALPETAFPHPALQLLR